MWVIENRVDFKKISPKTWILVLKNTSQNGFPKNYAENEF